MPEFEALCRGLESILYTPIMQGAPLDLCLLPSPQSLSQMLHPPLAPLPPGPKTPSLMAGSTETRETIELLPRPGTASSFENIEDRFIEEDINPPDSGV